MYYLTRRVKYKTKPSLIVVASNIRVWGVWMEGIDGAKQTLEHTLMGLTFQSKIKQQPTLKTKLQYEVKTFKTTRALKSFHTCVLTA